MALSRSFTLIAMFRLLGPFVIAGDDYWLDRSLNRNCLPATKATNGKENDSDKTWRQLVKTLTAAYLHGFRGHASKAEQSNSGFDLIGAEYCQKRDIIDGSADEVGFRLHPYLMLSHLLAHPVFAAMDSGASLRVHNVWIDFAATTDLRRRSYAWE
ncbi:hypothetical protein EV421DRAFT_1737649 [Armillaria borealis]|uniref:Uncharacterized protein n=1 Tax=Armillaria borealis TaxID=47425 RepID=A0AA39JG11_9AGAR|nr:hypothetical protein EV421DRAFT_1737649 [Armillaria borealis]